MMATTLWFATSRCQLLILCLGLFVAFTVGDGYPKQLPLVKEASSTQLFTLRHLFFHNLRSTRQAPAFVDFTTVRSTTNATYSLAASEYLPIKVHRPSVLTSSVEANDWTNQGQLSMAVPNITDKETIINLATMTSDVYYTSPDDPSWRNITQGFNESLPFGYEGDGLRGHVFANQDNSTVIVAFKGTTINWLDKTQTKDRLNDNLLFSCCCATQRPAPFWYGKVCNCRDKTYTCNATCLTSELSQPDRYYSIASAIVQNVTNDLFPTSDLWLTGHSLGGSLASLMGLTFDLPAISFEAPPERLPARRLGLVSQQGNSGEPKPRYPPYHFGNTADPVYMGACNGVSSLCALAGFSFESQCSTGRRCTYDTVGEKGWHSNVGNHRINTVIDDVLKVYDEVPECIEEDPECVDCAMWNFHQ